MSQIIFSDDFGFTWEVAYDDLDDAKLPIDLVRVADAGPFFGLREIKDDIAIVRSTTGGMTWEEIVDPLNAAGVAATPSGITYDQRTDRLFISYINQIYIFALYHASEVDVEQCNMATLVAPDILNEGVPKYWKSIKSSILGGDNAPPNGKRALLFHKKERP